MDNLLENYFPATIESAEAMVKFGQTIAIHLRPGDVLALIGNLGAGKTHLTQGIAKHFGYQGSVTSPTFGLIHEYEGSPLIHSDLYRLEKPSELLAIGWEEYLERNSIIIVEWADRFPDLIPQNSHWIKIDQ